MISLTPNDSFTPLVLLQLRRHAITILAHLTPILKFNDFADLNWCYACLDFMNEDESVYGNR